MYPSEIITQIIPLSYDRRHRAPEALLVFLGAKRLLEAAYMLVRVSHIRRWIFNTYILRKLYIVDSKYKT